MGISSSPVNERSFGFERLVWRTGKPLEQRRTESKVWIERFQPPAENETAAPRTDLVIATEKPLERRPPKNHVPFSDVPNAAFS